MSGDPEAGGKISGLCARCRHARPFQSGKGVTYLACEKNRTDPSFPKFPALPMRECAGFEPVLEDCGPATNEDR